MIYLIALAIALTAAGLESVSYFGFVAKHTGFSANFWYIISVIIGLSGAPLKLSLTKWLRLASFGSILAYVVLTIAEVLTYPNFVYTAMHVSLPGLQIFVLLISFHWLFNQNHGQKMLTRVARSLIMSALIFVAVEGIGLSLAFLIKGLIPVIKYPSATYEDKLVKSYGGFYPAMKMVVDLTPENALILIPPQGNPWEVEGNAFMAAYFLYPRKVKNLGD